MSERLNRSCQKQVLLLPALPDQPASPYPSASQFPFAFQFPSVLQLGAVFQLLAAFLLFVGASFLIQSSMPSVLYAKENAVGQKETAAQKVMEHDWCTIRYPERAVPEQTFTVEVTLKKIPAGLKLGGDLHHAKPGAYLGYASWGGDLRQAKEGETFTFKYKMPKFKAQNQGAQPIFFLTVKGWNEAELKAFGPVVLPLLTEEYLRTRRPESVSFKKSWISCGTPRSESGGEPVWRSGEKIEVPVEYFVHPEDDWGETQIVLWVLGPWIDCPDGKYAARREHKSGRCGAPNIKCEIGKRVKTSWTLTLPEAYGNAEPEKGKMGDGLLLVAQFRGADKENWPWQVRKSLPAFSSQNVFFELDAPTPGNLFTYDQPVEMRVIPGEKSEKLKEPQTLRWEVTNTKGKKVLSGEAQFPVRVDGKLQTLKIPMKLEEKGTFLLRAELQGKETREVTFARIPNLKRRIGTGPTFLGGQKFAGNEEAVKAARLLGMSVCRVWVNWNQLEPQPGIYPADAWNELKEQVDCLNRNHIRPWLLFDGMPPWAIDEAKKYGGSFTALPLRDADIERIITRLAKTFKGFILGFEWQNEIVPGEICKDPVQDYLRFCKIANAASKKVNPNFQNQLAGGLWPQTFRQNLISAGVTEAVDILPIHYGTSGSVRGAKRDLAVAGAERRVKVWDNETALGTSTWGMPLKEAMKETAQSDYFFTRFPDELAAGCEKIVVFGGEPSAAGDWSHFWSDLSPRPGAAALAVLVDALHEAKFAGEIFLGKNASLKLFERAGRAPILVVSSLEKGGETVRLAVGKKPVFQIDQQGNRTELKHKGSVQLRLTESPWLLEGGDLDILKAYVTLSFPGADSGMPSFSGAVGETLEIPIRLSNSLSHSIQGKVSLDAKTVPGICSSFEFDELASGEERSGILKIENLRAGTAAVDVTLKFNSRKLPPLTRKILIYGIDASEIGNLIQNPGFEEGKTADSSAEHWGGSGKRGMRVPFTDSDAVGHGKYVLQFEKTAGKYLDVFQPVPKLPNQGGEYLYSFWIRSENLTTGSNFGGTDSEGKSWNRHWLQVFQAPATQDVWQVFRKRLELPAGTVSVTPAPVCKGDGWSLVDNVQLVPYEGTEFSAMAPKAKGKIQIDGDLSDFQDSAPIPLIGRDQLRVTEGAAYAWIPKNLSAAAWFNYDAEFLYAAVEVLDDRHVVKHREAECVKDDSIRLAFHPMNRLPGEDAKAFCLDLSSLPPGGSGKHTIYRPKEYSGGLSAGALARDSSVYDISVKRVGNRTFYELAIPWSELGGRTGTVGTKVGLSILLRDSDADGDGPAAQMLWGEGLYPVWNPASFGVLTLTE